MFNNNLLSKITIAVQNEWVVSVNTQRILVSKEIFKAAFVHMSLTLALFRTGDSSLYEFTTSMIAFGSTQVLWLIQKQRIVTQFPIN